jgi:hypothetical protein
MVQVYVPVVVGSPLVVADVTVLLPLVSAQVTAMGPAYAVAMLKRAKTGKPKSVFVMCFKAPSSVTKSIPTGPNADTQNLLRPSDAMLRGILNCRFYVIRRTWEVNGFLPTITLSEYQTGGNSYVSARPRRVFLHD